METEVWFNGGWNKLSGSLAEFKTAYKNLTGDVYTKNDSLEGTFGGFYESKALYGGSGAKGEEGYPTGSRWND